MALEARGEDNQNKNTCAVDIASFQDHHQASRRLVNDVDCRYMSVKLVAIAESMLTNPITPLIFPFKMGFTRSVSKTRRRRGTPHLHVQIHIIHFSEADHVYAPTLKSILWEIRAVW